MDDFAEFERQVEEALAHLYDPAYHPHHLLCRHLGFRDLTLRAPQPIDHIRDALIQAIEQLQPTTDVPATARVRRIYDLLNLRYVQGKTQKETALRLGITVRHLRREQQLANHLLAERLWETPKTQTLMAEQPLQTITEQDEINWHEQVRQEIHILQANTPGMLANIQETLTAIIELEDALTAGGTFVLDVKPTEPDLWVATHPSVLREVLITATDKLIPSLQSSSVIQFLTVKSEESVEIVLSGCPATLAQLPDSKFIDEVLDIYGGNFAVRQQSNRVEFRLTLPLVNPIAVLIVDDNHDLVHFYRRYTKDTHYMIHHVAHGQHLWEQINAVPPDVIVLDVMLPDVGGWDVLRQLRKHPLTKTVPIIICSVIQNEELAKTLGANLYLSKPVHRNDFLRALDVVSSSTTLG